MNELDESQLEVIAGRLNELVEAVASLKDEAQDQATSLRQIAETLMQIEKKLT